MKRRFDAFSVRIYVILGIIDIVVMIILSYVCKGVLK